MALLKKFKYILLLLALLALGLYIFVGKAILDPNTKADEETYIEIPTDASFDDVVKILESKQILHSSATFRRVAAMMKYNKAKVPAGRYKIKSGLSNKSLITKLRSGDQDPTKVVVNNIRLISDLAGKASRYFEADSMSFLTYITDTNTHTQLGFNRDNFMTMFIPNTYEMFWTSTPDKFVARMKKEYDGFWNTERENKIKALGLDRIQAYIIASIVEKESNYDPERPAIAGVYLNRFLSGEKLQADPTVVFSTGDFNIQRVLFSHLETDSPYNTYKYAGLPPGPICMPSTASLEAVVNAERHKYMFFCAKADNSGKHAFAVTFEEHQRNASAFSAWMNQQGIK